jgi:uroporphyrinogen decarboxylase
VPVIVFTKGGGQWLPVIADCGAQAVGIDWTTDIATARQPSAIAWPCRATWTR